MLEISLDKLTAEEVAKASKTFRELCRLTSIEEAVALCARYEGLELVIPASEKLGAGDVKETKLRGELRDILCGPSYEKFLFEYGGTKFPFPKLDSLRRRRRDKLIRHEFDTASVQCDSEHNTTNLVDRLVVKHNMTRRHIYRILKQSD